MIKGQAWRESFALVNLDGTPNTTGTPSVDVAQDDGDFVAHVGGTQRLVDAVASSVWYVDLSESEMDADLVDVLVTCEGCFPVHIKLCPEAVWTEEVAGRIDVPISDIADTQAAILARFAQAVLSPVSPISAAGRITVYQGIDYSAGLGNSIDFALPASTHGDLAEATIELRSCVHWLEGSVVDAGTEDQVARFELTHEESAALQACSADYMLIVTLSDSRVPTPKARGELVVAAIPPSLEPEPTE